MAGSSDKNGSDKTTDKPSVGFTLPFAERAPTNPMDVMAAATAAGFALSTQFASAFFGMMQAAMEATAKPVQAAAQKPAADAPVADQTVAQKPVADAGAAAAAEQPVVVALAGEPAATVVPQAKPVQPAIRKAKVAKPAEVAAKPVKPEGKPAKAKVTAVAKPAAAKTKAPGKVAVSETKTVEPKARPAAARKGKAGADLKQISGIGPKLEGLLNGMGVKSLKDIAAWTDEDVAHFDGELGLDGRIAKDNWIAQAKTLLR
jgi:NADH-quinone oxidoreductase subunit E